MADLTLFFDESGFTGADLLNPEQPHFCVATTAINDEIAGQILAKSFPRYQGDEFKFTNIWRRHRNRDGLLEFARLVGEKNEDVFIYWIDKKFCVLTKLVDFLIEPPAHKAGLDFYAGGYAPRYCNMWYYGIQFFGTPELYDRTVEIYQAFARDPSLRTLSNLQITLEIMANSVADELRVFYKAASLGARTFLQLHDLDEHRSSSEIQFTTVLQCVAHWRNIRDEDFIVLHDKSSNFFRSSELWERITGPKVPQQIHEAADGSANRFPLRVTQTEAVDSRDHAGIQLCDVLAGLASKVLRQRNGDYQDAFVRSILEAGLDKITYDGIRPEYEFPNGEPLPLHGPDAVDQLIGIMFPKQSQG
jgi:Protein of unknown function (DUF3800)